MTALNETVDLSQLEVELIAANVEINGLGTTGDPPDEIFTYDEDGAAIDLPPGAAAVLAAHVPQPPPPSVWTVIRSYIPYSEGPEDVLTLLDMQAAAMGGADPEE